MDIVIRNLSPKTVESLDEFAKKKGKSRQEYLKGHLEGLSSVGLHSTTLDRFDKQIEVNSLWLQKNSETLEEFISIIKELLDMDLE